MKPFNHLTFLLPFYILHSLASANTIQQNLFINRGVFTTVKQTTFPFLAFNETSGFNSLNKVVSATTNDTILFSVINNDSVPHGFAIKNSSFTPLLINAGDTANAAFSSLQEKVLLYYDHLNYPHNSYLGLAGMICINNSANKKFYWNIRAHQTNFNTELANGNTVNWSNYEPDYFTVNGLSFPDLQNDSSAIVNANIGDTVLIFAVNTGQSLHSIHFHGFHCKVLFSTSPRIITGSEKDTFAMQRMEGAVLQMIPDKVGKYSVHDHNLVAVSGGGTHPNGMFLIMQIE